MKGAWGVRRSAGGYKRARGSTNERRRVQTSAGEYERARGSTKERGGVRTSTGGTNTAGAAAGATCLSSLIPLPLPPFLFLFLLYYLDIFHNVFTIF